MLNSKEKKIVFIDGWDNEKYLDFRRVTSYYIVCIYPINDAGLTIKVEFKIVWIKKSNQNILFIRFVIIF